ncbi:MAG: hypothetical protein ACREHG_11330, partial [Candidatus Saccharimonadales bacterium]
FAAAASSYTEAGKAGVGSARVLLPDRLQKTVTKIFPAAEYAPSTPAGSFARGALATSLDVASWADAVLLAGDFGHNSETAIFLEQFVSKHKGPLAVTHDGLDYFTGAPRALAAREETLLVCSFAQLQKFAASINFAKAFTIDMDLLRLVDLLHEFSQDNECSIVVKHLKSLLVAVNGEISTTSLSEDRKIWRVRTAARAVTWWLQNPARSFEAITSSILNLEDEP